MMIPTSVLLPVVRNAFLVWLGIRGVVAATGAFPDFNVVVSLGIAAVTRFLVLLDLRRSRESVFLANMAVDPQLVGLVAVVVALVPECMVWLLS